MKFGLSRIRELAVLILFSRQLNPDQSLDSIFAYIMDNYSALGQEVSSREIDEEELAAMEEARLPLERVSCTRTDSSAGRSYRHLTDREKAETKVPSYLKELVNGVMANQDQLDRIIDDHIEGRWSVRRLELINLIILRVISYELCYVDEERVPQAVAIDEAMELTRKYSDEASRRFNNGVLSSIASQMDQKK